MKGIIIYKSKYGATKQYADWLGELLHIPSVFLDHITHPTILITVYNT